LSVEGAECFLNSLLPTDVTNTIRFQIDEIEKKLPQANRRAEFSHSLGQTQKSRQVCGKSVHPPGADIA
jgi:hypothetical protein